MPTLQDIRTQYPQYKDMSDQQLADSLHAKFYSDMPKDQFDTKLGITSAAPGKIPQQDQMGTAEQFFTGVGNTAAGAKQLYTNITGTPQEAQKANTGMQERQADIQRRGGLGIAGTIGEAVPGMIAGAAVPALGFGGMAGSMVGGALGGGVSGAAQPVTTPNYWDQKQDDILMGTAFGAGASGAVHALGSILAPNLGAAQKALVKTGVQLTPGQMTGGVIRRAEEAFKSLPILGSFIRGAEGRGIEGFNKGVLNQALEPIQQKLDPGTQAGHAALIETSNKLGAAYDAILPKMKLQLDPDLAQNMGDVLKSASDTLPKAQAEQFSKIVNSRIQPYFVNGAGGLKKMAGDLRAFANQYRSSPMPAERDMARHFDDVRTAIDKAIARQNSQYADKLKKIDAGWSMLARAEQAASRRATSEGVFTPNDLLQTIKSQDKTVRHRRFAQGTADPLLQLYAEYGQKVLPGKLPDSGTTERAMYDAAILAGGIGAESGHINPLIPMGLAAGAAPYTKIGMGAANAMAKEAGPVRGALGSIVRKTAPSAGGLAGGAATGPEYGGPRLD